MSRNNPPNSPATLIEGDIKQHLVRLTVPMIWGILAMHSINIADTWFVAQLGKSSLAAMSFTFPVVMLLLSLGIGFMAGTSSVLSRVIGNGDHERVKRLTTDSILLATVCSIVLSVVGLLTLDRVFLSLGASEELLPLIREYMVIWFAGYVFLLVPMAGVGCLRATGDAKVQSRILLLAAVINLILDPILIFGLMSIPAFGIAGAAIATIVARGVTMIIGFKELRKRDMISLKFPALEEMLGSWKSVAHVGLPAAGTNMIIPLGTGVIVAMVAGYGQDAVAGHGAAARIESLAMVVFLAMSSMIGPFMGQNVGACRNDRIQQAMSITGRFCVLWGFGLSLVTYLSARFLMSFFSDDPAVVEIGRQYLLYVTLGFGAAGIVMNVNAAFNGLGRPLPGVVISTSRIFLFMIPAAWLGGLVLGLKGVFLGILFANVVAASVGYVWFQKTAAGSLKST